MKCTSAIELLKWSDLIQWTKPFKWIWSPLLCTWGSIQTFQAAAIRVKNIRRVWQIEGLAFFRLAVKRKRNGTTTTADRMRSGLALESWSSTTFSHKTHICSRQTRARACASTQFYWVRIVKSQAIKVHTEWMTQQKANTAFGWTLCIQHHNVNNRPYTDF